MKNKEINVVVADDHDLIRQGLRRIISLEEGMKVVAEADNGQDALAIIKRYEPDVIVLDMRMPLLDGMDVLRNIAKKQYRVKTIMLTVENDKKIIQDAIEIGADGYLLKDSAGQEIVDAIQTVYSGNKYIDQSLITLLFTGIQSKNQEKKSILDELTKRELDVLFYMSKGLSNKEISGKLYLSEKTIKNYATKMYRKLNVNDRVQATIVAIANQIDEYYKE